MKTFQQIVDELHQAQQLLENSRVATRSAQMLENERLRDVNRIQMEFDSLCTQLKKSPVNGSTWHDANREWHKVPEKEG